MSSPVKIPTLILRQLYTFGSLENVTAGVQFSLKNRLSDATVKELRSLKIDGQEVLKHSVTVDLGEGVKIKLQDNMANPPSIDLPLGKSLNIVVHTTPLAKGKHLIEFDLDTDPFGELQFSVEDSISIGDESIVRIPRDSSDDYSDDIIAERQAFVESFTDTELHHLKHYSFDAHETQGNIEHFTGVAQIPIGFAGPIHIDGEHANGEFLIPLATTEGTLVASYNRGIKVLNLSGGVKCTVVGDQMQRAPVFVFENARGARQFIDWVKDHMPQITEQAESTSSVAKLKHIEHYISNKFAFLRFNFLTGDAAGQNMVGRATFAACSWIIDTYENEVHPIEHFYLESNFATDKKSSQVNVMHTRGKRVTAEAVVKRDVLIQHMRVEPEALYYHSKVSNVGAQLSGANNNGAHSPNAITAMFIALGQDVANVAESSAGVIYSEMTPDGDFYVSITIPSLIVATYGGGTGLPTQRECLQVLGCYGRDKVNKLAEIVAGVALAGELSLGAAISSSDWVSSHEKYGRNR